MKCVHVSIFHLNHLYLFLISAFGNMLGGLQIDLSQYGMDIIKPLAGMFVDLQAYFLYMIGITCQR